MVRDRAEDRVNTTMIIEKKESGSDCNDESSCGDCRCTGGES